MVNLDEGGRGDAALRLLVPPPRLTPWVEFFWIQERHRPDRDRPWRIIPDGNAHIIFVVESTDTGERSRCSFVGARPVHHDIDVTHRRLTVGARLRLTTLARLTRASATEFTGRSVRVEQVLGATGRALTERMSQSDGPTAVSHLIGYLEERVNSLETDTAIDVATRSARTVGSLATLMNLSTRGVHARAVEMTGLGPKLLLRIIRLQRALLFAQASDASWVDIAYRVGYADQSHMVREFRSLLGEPPEAWRLRASADSYNTRSRGTTSVQGCEIESLSTP